MRKQIRNLSYIAEKLDLVHSNLDKHIEESKIVRDEIVKHGEQLIWHNKWLCVVSIGLLVIFGLITGIKFIG